MPSYPFKLICVHPFHDYTKGQEILDPEEISAHLEDREHHFVRAAVTDFDVMRLQEMQEAARADTDEALNRAAAKGRDKEGRYQG